MTAPVVGQVSVEIIASARALAKSLKSETEKAFKDLDLSKLIQDSIGKQKVKLPIEADFDTDGFGEKVRRTRVPKVPVEVDPLLAQFQQQVRRQVASLGRQVNASIPVGADTSQLRAELGAQLKAVQAQSRIAIPTEPGEKAEYEARLKAELEEVAHRVKQHVKVDVDVDKGGGGALGAVGGILKGISQAIPNIGGISNAVSGLGGALQNAAGSSAQLGGNLAGAAESATGPIGIVIGLLVTAAAAAAALAGAATLIVPAMSAAAGAAAAIPAALVGAGAIFGTLGLGLKGISEAFKPKVGGGGGGGASATNQSRQIAAASRSVEAARRGIAAANRSLQASERGLEQAERGVTSAELAVTQAQQRSRLATEAVSKARREAAEDIDDLNRSLRGAKLSEEDAALGVTEALRALNQVKLTGNIPDIQRADLAYREAQQTLDEAKDTTLDLTDATATANKQGVEGSDKVQQALRDQADAVQGVAGAQQSVVDAQNSVLSAQDALLSAQDGVKASADSLASAQDSLAQSQEKVATSSAAAAAKLIPLAPAALAFVSAIKALKPAFEDLRLDVQQRLFAGLDKTVTHLGDAWIKPLKATLGSYADTFNDFFRTLGANISTPEFIARIQTGAEGARRGLESVGKAVSGPLVDAFGRLSAAAGPFLTQLGTEIADAVTEFSSWIIQADKSKSLTTFFETATRSMHDLFTTGKLVFKIVGDLFQILTGSNFGTGKKTGLESFNDGLEKVHAFLADPKNAGKITGFFNDLKDGIASLVRTTGQISGFLTKVQGIYDKLFPAEAGTRAKSFGGQIGTFLITGLIAGLGAAVKASFLSIGTFFVIGPDSLLGRIKSLLGIASPSTVMFQVGVDLIQGLINGVGGFLANLATAAGQIATTVIRTVGNGATWLVAAGHNTVVGLVNGVGSMFATLGTYAGRLRTTITNALANAGSLLVNAGKNVVIGLANGIGSLLSLVGTYAGYARTYISNALSNAGSLLYNAGRNVIIGLINGIGSMIGTLGNYLGNVGQYIVDHKGPPSKDKVLLVGAGRAIVGGLISGMEDKKAALGSQLSDLSSMVANTDMPALASDLGSVAGSLSKASTWEASWAPGMTGDKILDALRGTILFKYRGNSVAALSTA